MTKATLVPRALRADARANREKLLEAVREAIAERGIRAEMREIAARAGLAVGTIYRHFGSKQALVEALHVQASGELTLALEHGLANPDPALGLRDFLLAAARHVERYGFLLADPEQRRGSTRTDRMIIELLERGRRSGRFREGLDEEFVLDIMHAVFASSLYVDLVQQLGPEALANRYARILLGGVLAQGGDLPDLDDVQARP
jgi:AcrR family transcriptional regulator